MRPSTLSSQRPLREQPQLALERRGDQEALAHPLAPGATHLRRQAGVAHQLDEAGGQPLGVGGEEAVDAVADREAQAAVGAARPPGCASRASRRARGRSPRAATARARRARAAGARRPRGCRGPRSWSAAAGPRSSAAKSDTSLAARQSSAAPWSSSPASTSCSSGSSALREPERLDRGVRVVPAVELHDLEHERTVEVHARAGAPRGPAGAARGRGCASRAGRCRAARPGGGRRAARRARRTRAGRASSPQRVEQLEPTRSSASASGARRVEVAAPGDRHVEPGREPERARVVQHDQVGGAVEAAADALAGLGPGLPVLGARSRSRPPRSPCSSAAADAPQVGIREQHAPLDRHARHRPRAAARRRAARAPGPARPAALTWRTRRRAAAPRRPGPPPPPDRRRAARSRPEPAGRLPSAAGRRPRRQRTSRAVRPAGPLPRTSPSGSPRSTDLVAVLEEGAGRAVRELDRLAAGPATAPAGSRAARARARRSCPLPSRSPTRSDAPLEVRCAICWAIDQYRCRALVRAITAPLSSTSSGMSYAQRGSRR